MVKLLGLSNWDIFSLVAQYMSFLDFLSLKRAVEGKTLRPVGLTPETQA